MLPFPHHYTVTTVAAPLGDILVERSGLPTIRTDAPVDFDGPGDRWSPEDLLVAAVADCFALTFRGIARRSSLGWTGLTASVRGRLERVDRVTRFTHLDIHVRVQLPPGASDELARRVATKAEETCLITRSLTASVQLDVEIAVEAPAAV